MPIAENCARVLDTVREAEITAGRDEGAVTVIAVTKTRTAAEVDEVLRCGITHAGENRLQEAAGKIPDVASPAIWHMIGHLQSNKVKQAAGLFDWVDSIDTQKTADRLSQALADDADPIEVLVQVNISGEGSKSGIEPDRAVDLAGYVHELPGLRLRGLMTIGTFGASEPLARTEFAKMQRLFEDVRAGTGEMVDVLSMGMSGDYALAIAEGATMVRIGTAIFGVRR